MKLIVDNLKTKAVMGGSDHLLDFDVMKELDEYMRVRPKGYAYSPLYKKRVWDGWRRFINKKGEFATGFLPMVVDFLRSKSVTLAVEDLRTNLIHFEEPFDDFIGRIDGVDWVGRDYQVDLAKAAEFTLKINDSESIYFPRGILDCATNAGKNSIAALIMKNVPRETEIVFTVSNQIIFKQAYEFFKQVFPDEEIGVVASGNIDPKRVTVCMVKTLKNQLDKVNIRSWLSRVDLLIVDECDEAGAKEYSEVIMAIGASMRIFMSGTPLDAAIVNTMVSIGLSGKILGKITNKELIDKGVSQNPVIKILLNNSRKVTLDKSYGFEDENYVMFSEHRVGIIADLIEEDDTLPTVITFTKLDHGYFMLKKLEERLPFLRIGIVHGPNAEYDCNREEVLDDFKSGNIDVLLASTVLKRGANIPNIRRLIIGNGGKSKITVKQYIGRAVRHDGENDDVLVYDFYDVGDIVGKHSRERIRHYKNEEFEIEYDFEQKRGMPIL